MRIVGFLMVCVMLAACASTSDLKDPPVPLGDFSLGHNIVVAPKVQKLAISRPATEEELTQALTQAIADRFDRYESPRTYHFGVSVEGYNLATPGIPLVLAPKSAMIVRLTVWDDAAGKKLNEKPEQITVLESFGSGALIGSGYTLTREEQLVNLAENVSKAIERFLVKQNAEAGWFQPQSPEELATPVAVEAEDVLTQTE